MSGDNQDIETQPPAGPPLPVPSEDTSVELRLDPPRTRSRAGWISLLTGIVVLLIVILLLRLAVVTDYMYHSAVKDPERSIPPGDNIVAPADGLVLYVKRFQNGEVPDIVKQGVPVRLDEMIKTTPPEAIQDGYLIGIYMNTESVHVNRVPVDGVLAACFLYNGPHMAMSGVEKSAILTAMVPGLTSIKKVLGMEPFAISKAGDYIMKSARETCVYTDLRGEPVYVIRIADYWVGNLLNWIEVGQPVTKGQRMGVITWGSQTDICFPSSENMTIHVSVGDYVYAGETILATR